MFLNDSFKKFAIFGLTMVVMAAQHCECA
jgi:hypothetical protein